MSKIERFEDIEAQNSQESAVVSRESQNLRSRVRSRESGVKENEQDRKV